MANARILYHYDTWDAARAAGKITASSDRDERRVGNLLLDPLGKRWEPSAKTGQWAKLDLQAPARITCFGAIGGNWTATATLYLEANSSDSWSPPAYSQQLTIAVDADGSPWRHLVSFLDQTYRWWRFTWDDPANPASHLQLGRLIAGQYYELSRNFSRGARITWSDPTAIEHKPGTVENVPDEQLQRFRQVRAAFAWRGTSEMAKWEAIHRKVGRSRPMVLALDPANAPTAKSLYGYLVTDLEASWEHYTRFDIATLVFEEKSR